MKRRWFRAASGLLLVSMGAVAACDAVIGLGPEPTLKDECAGQPEGDCPCEPGTTKVCAYTGPDKTEGVGACKAGVRTCNADGLGFGACEGEVVPVQEVCDPEPALDENCDGTLNEGCDCVPGTEAPCYGGPTNTEGVGACKAGTKACQADGKYGPCVGDVQPGVEDCDAAGIDEDCNGLVNESGASCTCGDGFVSSPELCDDGNTEETDGCSNACQNLREVEQVAMGGSFTCALLNEKSVDGTTRTLKCWGSGSLGQLGITVGGLAPDAIGDDVNEMGANLDAVAFSEKPIAVVAGLGHTCALLASTPDDTIDDNIVRCWGNDNQCQVGVTFLPSCINTKHLTPQNSVNFGAIHKPIEITAGDNHTCARVKESELAKGKVRCWGANGSGQLGIGSTYSQSAADEVPLGGDYDAMQVVAGGNHTCALLADNTVKCWGANDKGQLGLGNTTDASNPENLPGVDLGDGIIDKLVAGAEHTCALFKDKRVKCWGRNAEGELLLGDKENRGGGLGEMGEALPVANFGDTVEQITAGKNYTCALLTSGITKCAGTNANGELGQGHGTTIGIHPWELGPNLPVTNLGSVSPIRVMAGRGNHACAILADGSIKCWGLNSNGQLGLGDTPNRGDGPGEMGANLPAPKLFNGTW